MAKEYVITEKTTHRILEFGKTLGELENGYIHLVEENVAFPPELVFVYKVTIPAEVAEGYYKYCYTEEDGFYLDPNCEEEDVESTEE